MVDLSELTALYGTALHHAYDPAASMGLEEIAGELMILLSDHRNGERKGWDEKSTAAVADRLLSVMAMVGDRLRATKTLCEDRAASIKAHEEKIGDKVVELVRLANRGADVHPLNDKSVRQAVWSLTGGHCAYCEAPLGVNFSVEHVVPKSLGGPDNLANYVPACMPCNSSKHASHVLEFIDRQFPNRRARPALKVVGSDSQAAGGE